MQRKIRDATEARRCLQAAESAGLTAGEWARQHGIDGRSLHAWRMNLARSKRSPRHGDGAARLVELIPSPHSPTDARYLVCVGDLAVEVPEGFDEPTLLRLIRALRAC